MKPILSASISQPSHHIPRSLFVRQIEQMAETMQHQRGQPLHRNAAILAFAPETGVQPFGTFFFY